MLQWVRSRIFWCRDTNLSPALARACACVPTEQRRPYHHLSPSLACASIIWIPYPLSRGECGAALCMCTATQQFPVTMSVAPNALARSVNLGAFNGLHAPAVNVSLVAICSCKNKSKRRQITWDHEICSKGVNHCVQGTPQRELRLRWACHTRNTTSTPHTCRCQPIRRHPAHCP